MPKGKSSILPDSLHAHQPHQLQNRHRIACAERFFSFTADDSVQLHGDLMFAQNPVPKQQGFQSYVDIGGLAPGRHMFKVNRMPISKEDSTDKKEGGLLHFETEIPFWVE